MIRNINKLILKILGYTVDYENILPQTKKCVLLFVPHTSMLDFVVGKMALTAMGVKTVFLIKKEFFWFPLGPTLKRLGGVPVDRKNAKNFAFYAAQVINSREEVAFLISPEGTRKRNPNWKKGFYVITQQAKVPLMLGYLDYATKRAGIGPEFKITGNYEEDMKKIKEYYHGMRGRHKGQFELEDLPHAHPDWVKE